MAGVGTAFSARLSDYLVCVIGTSFTFHSIDFKLCKVTHIGNVHVLFWTDLNIMQIFHAWNFLSYISA